MLFSAVYRQANNINMLKDGMKIEATHVKKRQLHQYLPPEVLQKKKRVCTGRERPYSAMMSKILQHTRCTIRTL